MDKFITTNNGGLPSVLNDIRFIDASVRQAILGILSAYGSDPGEVFILSGCSRNVVDSVVTITEGYISLAGEVFHVAEHSYPEPAGGEIEYFSTSITYDPSGLKTFQNGTSEDCYEIRKAKVSVSLTPVAPYTVYSDAKTIFDIIEDSLPQIASNTAALATKASATHTHTSLNYLAVVKAQTVYNGLKVTGNLYTTDEAVVQGGVITIKEGEAEEKKAFIHRFAASDSLGIRVDIDDTPNYSALFEFKDNGDMTFSDISDRIRERDTGTVIGSTSDARLKKDVKPLSPCLELVLQLNPVTHKWKRGKDKLEKYGFIAQEVEPILPHLIDTSNTGYKSLDYPKMVVILTKALQEQQQQIDDLKNQIQNILDVH